tara:strand:+ start:399 stop:1103 length:705 start_codon:yes stop_codon:yes gene_type:complete
MIDLILEIFTYNANASQAVAYLPMLIGAGLQIGSGLLARRGKAERLQEIRDARDEYDTRKADYMSLDTSNPYNNMENVFDDLRVNTQQADFQAEQIQQQQANILGSLQGAAGGSGIAALAQTLANQGTQATRQASISLGQQEQANQMARLQEESRLQNLQRQGDVYSRSLIKDRTETLLGMSQTRLRDARAAEQRSMDRLVGGVGAAAGGLMQAGLSQKGGGTFLEQMKKIFNP